MKNIGNHWRVKKAKNTVARLIIESKTYDPNTNHYIFADPRGGSTWLTEIIQEVTQDPIIWEPLQLNLKNNPFKLLNFDWRQYIPENEEWPEAKELFDLLFNGKILNRGILYHSNFSQCITSKSLLFKFCRGNALIPWLTKKYNFKYKPIHLVRHPFAVISSQLRHGGWDYNFEGFNIPKTPYNEHYKIHSKFLSSLKTKEEVMTTYWCLSNLPTLNNARNNKDWITINYENFVSKPQQTIGNIFSAWNLDYDISKINFSKNSKTTKNDSPKQVEKRISHWQTSLTEAQKDRMGSVLDYFEVKCYTMNEAYPIEN